MVNDIVISSVHSSYTDLRIFLSINLLHANGKFVY